MTTQACSLPRPRTLAAAPEMPTASRSPARQQFECLTCCRAFQSAYHLSVHQRGKRCLGRKAAPSVQPGNLVVGSVTDRVPPHGVKLSVPVPPTTPTPNRDHYKGNTPMHGATPPPPPPDLHGSPPTPINWPPASPSLTRATRLAHSSKRRAAKHCWICARAFDSHSELVQHRQAPGHCNYSNDARLPAELPPPDDCYSAPPGFNPLKPCKADRSGFGQEIITGPRQHDTSKLNSEEAHALNDKLRERLEALGMRALIAQADPSIASRELELSVGGLLAELCAVPARVPRKRRPPPKEKKTMQQARQELVEIRRELKEMKRGDRSYDADLKRRQRWLLRILKLEKEAAEQKETEKKQERIRKKYSQNPQRAIESLDESPRVSPTFDQPTCEAYFKKILTDDDRMRNYDWPSWMPRCPAAQHSYDWFDTSVSAVRQALLRMKNNSAPGGDGLSYRDYKVLRNAISPYISQLFRRVIDTQQVPDVWKYGRIILIHKAAGTPTDDPANFRPICLTNTLGKLFMTMFARSLATWCRENGVINTEWQKGFMPGVSGTTEHAFRIVGALRNAKAARREIVQVFIDLANAFGSVSHSHILFMLARAGLPPDVQRLVQDYYTNLRVVVDTGSFVSQPIEQLIGVFQGCPLSPIIFNLALGALYDWYAQPEFKPYAYHFKVPAKVPALYLLGTGFADDIGLVTRKPVYAQLLLDGTDRFLAWSITMAAKPAKCKAIGIKRVGDAMVVFDPMLIISGKPISMIKLEDGFKILGKFFYQDLSLERQQDKLLSKLSEKLTLVDSSHLAANQKVHSLRFTLNQWIGWELAIYELPISWVERTLDPLVNRFVKKWLALPHGSNMDFAYIGLDKHGLDLPSPSRLFRQRQASSWHILKYSDDPQVIAFYLYEKSRLDLLKRNRFHGARLLEETEARLLADQVAAAKADDNVISITMPPTAEQRHAAIAAGDKSAAGSKDSRRAHRQKLLSSIRDSISTARKARLDTLTVQGRALAELGKSEHDKTWLARVLQIPENLLRFGVKSLLDVLPTRCNLTLWKLDNSGVYCRLCANLPPSARKYGIGPWRETTQHVLCSCEATLSKRRWRHDSVLWAVTRTIERKLLPGCRLLVDLASSPKHHYTVFPLEFGVETLLKPDMLIVDDQSSTLLLIELSVPAEDNIDERHRHKRAKYAPLVAELRERNAGWHIECLCFEVGARGIHESSFGRMLQRLAKLRVADKFARSESTEAAIKISTIALRASRTIWMTRKTAAWPADQPLILD